MTSFGYTAGFGYGKYLLSRAKGGNFQFIVARK